LTALAVCGYNTIKANNRLNGIILKGIKLKDMENNKTETIDKLWCNINNHEGYLISNYGDVISFRKRNSTEFHDTPKMLKQVTITTHCGKEYNRVMLLGKQKYVHRLVAEHFIDNKNNKPQVNHIDGDGTNNIVTNLEWVTNSENQTHRFKINGTKNKLGQYVHKNRTAYRVYKKGVIDKSFKNLTDAQSFAKQYY
jgi:hypothetical protein